MAGWWRKNPYFVEYMVHEGTAVFVAIYALILLVSLVKLGAGEQAWNQWVDFLASPLSIGLHVLLLAGFLYHTWTWFNIMPRTLPPIMVAGKRLEAGAIVRGGLLAATIASLVLLGVCWLLAK
jgi:fumarate reductase subunit C